MDGRKRYRYRVYEYIRADTNRNQNTQPRKMHKQKNAQTQYSLYCNEIF